MEKIWYYIPVNYKFKHWALCFCLLLPGIILGQQAKLSVPNDYQKVFGDNYTKAIQFLLQENWIKKDIENQKIDPDFALAIVFPELIRYSAIRDFVEIQGLLTLYVQYGSSYANFSVGHFQMKPTFAEQIENDASRIFKTGIYSTAYSEMADQRLERVKRLQSTSWQVKYLISFIQIMDHRFKNCQWMSVEDKLEFYATAFNSGYCRTAKQLADRNQLAGFHVALFKDTPHYRYSDIALYYFKQIHHK